MIASGLVLAVCKAAARIAGAVLRPSGSIMMAPGSIPISASCSFENAIITFGEPFFVPSSISVKTKDFYPEQSTWVDESGIAGHEGLSYQATWFAKYLSEGRIESEVHTHAETVEGIAIAHEITTQIGAKPF